MSTQPQFTLDGNWQEVSSGNVLLTLEKGRVAHYHIANSNPGNNFDDFHSLNTIPGKGPNFLSYGGAEKVFMRTPFPEVTQVGRTLN